VEFAWQTPLSRKIKDGQTKWLLRQVLYKYVPKELIERPKMGFSVPVATWLRGPLREWAEALINDSDIPLLDKNLILKVWNQHQSAASDNSNKLWALLMFLDWYQHRNFRYIEKGRA
ncbi:asparagine synthase-related protein, partial [Oleiphilus sp. HI0080]|uniref:asparagine synthase-related protein n=1 Tax=Oleiphilus sp. HI0080 TaxID=1822255 RepID=UPI0009ED9B5B